MTFVRFILSEAGHSYGNNDCRHLEIKRDADRSEETWRGMSPLLSREDRSFIDLVETVIPGHGLLLLGLWRSASWSHYKTPGDNEHIKGLAVHHGYHYISLTSLGQ